MQRQTRYADWTTKRARKGLSSLSSPRVTGPNSDFKTTIRTIRRDRKKRWILVDNSGKVRIGDTSKQVELKAECAGLDRKVVKFNKKLDKMFFVSANDRSLVVEVDLTTLDLKLKEHRFKNGKIIDLDLADDRFLVVLNKEGKVEIKDLERKELTKSQLDKIKEIQDKIAQGDQTVKKPKYMVEYEETFEEREYELQQPKGGGWLRRFRRSRFHFSLQTF